MKLFNIIASLGIIAAATAEDKKSACHSEFPCAHSVAGNCTHFDLNNEWRAEKDSRQFNETWLFADCPNKVLNNSLVTSKLDLRNCVANDEGVLVAREGGGSNGKICTLSNPPPVPVGKEPSANITLQCWMPGHRALKEVDLLAFQEVGLSDVVWVDTNGTLGCYGKLGNRVY
ncbi:CVNH domain-containing protein [Colletotrichum scovillei]|uniref:CVNH domain-containing protein n=1 Tax=Colletotrichum scovillei TaxID=1209932 RepID=A0A9P7U6G3_9PEZI|nr:CVNH domain-containing protein [Colletotrichum scovillei]KAG7046183.1 CVNH domain-containing protein [Colletotrichum scovillei]KAG7063530.1 CVNH domain-containing protein [Colletotrichum scovillei]